MEILRFTRTGHHLPDTHQYTHGQRTSQEAAKSRRKPKSTRLATGLLRTLPAPGQIAAAVDCRAELHLRISVQLTGLGDQPEERTSDALARALAVPFHPASSSGASRPAPRAPRRPGLHPRGQQEGGLSERNTIEHACRCARAAGTTRPDLTASTQPGHPAGLAVTQKINVIICYSHFAFPGQQDSLEGNHLDTVMTYREVYAAVERETAR